MLERTIILVVLFGMMWGRELKVYNYLHLKLVCCSKGKRLLSTPELRYTSRKIRLSSGEGER